MRNDYRSLIDIDTSEFRVCSDNCVLRSAGVGSCVIITLYDPVKKIGGLAHSMLPYSNDKYPGAKYVDSAIELMIKKMEAEGADVKRFEAKIAGGADIIQDLKTRDIGAQNVSAAIEKLREKGIKIIAKDVGGNCGRNVDFNVADGSVLINSELLI